MELIERLREFIENEAQCCSMDFGCVTPINIIECGEEMCHSKR